MFGKKKDKKKKKQARDVFVSLTANGAPVEALNFTLAKNPDGSPRAEVYTKDVCEALHYDEIDFELKTTLKMVRVRGRFTEAHDEKKFKVYVYSVEDFSQYYI